MVTLANEIIRRWPSDRSRRWLESLLADAKYDTNIVVIVAIGSAIREDVLSEDLDLIVLCRNRRALGKRAPIEIDLRVFEVRRVEEEIVSGQDLLIWAVQYGRALWDPYGVWKDIVARWKNRIPLPNPAIARFRAKETKTQLENMRRVGDENATIELEVSYLTHLGRAVLSEAGVFPASRPEMPDQLRRIGQGEMARKLEGALFRRKQHRSVETVL